MSTRAIAFTTIALICFAGNSLLCRLALAGGRIDATSFTAVRLATGAAVLVALTRRRIPDPRSARDKWISAAALFVYAAPFSYAYLRLGAAIGALILFATVQATMVGWGVFRGERPGRVAWGGIAVALGGLVALTVPGRSAPDLASASMMALAGVAWGAYSLLGRGASGDPASMTASSFVRSLPMAGALVAVVVPTSSTHGTPLGLALAATSGALASGAGYSVWYAALRHLSATRAAVLQLLVPVLAAGGAVALLGEVVSLRLVGASAAILGGVALTILERSRTKGQ